MQQLRPAGDLLGTTAVIIGFQIDGAAIQRCRHGQHLEGRTRLISVGQHPVAPLLQLRPVECLLISIRISRLLQLLQRRCCIFIGNFQIIVRVIAAQSRHCKDLAGFGVHHQSESSVLHIVACNGRFHLFFKACLYGCVQGQDQAVSLTACNVLFIRKGHVHFIVSL